MRKGADVQRRPALPGRNRMLEEGVVEPPPSPAARVCTHPFGAVPERLPETGDQYLVANLAGIGSEAIVRLLEDRQDRGGVGRRDERPHRRLRNNAREQRRL